MDTFEKGIRLISQWFDRIAQVFLALMMLVVVVNVILRAVWQSMPGSFEIAGYLGAIVVGFALAHCGVKGRFVAITIIIDRLPKRSQAIIGIITGILSICLFFVAAWYCGKLATDIWHAGELSPTLRFSYFPLVYAVGFGCLLLSLSLLVRTLKLLIQVAKNE